MTRVVNGPARCIECRAVWRVVHAILSEEGCIRCGGRLEALDDGVELFPKRGTRRFEVATAHPADEPSDPGLRIEPDAAVESDRLPGNV